MAADHERRRRDARRAIESMIAAALDEAASTADAAGRSGRPETAVTDGACAALAKPKGPRVILVDGFNVLHATLDTEARHRAWWIRSRREALLARLARWREPRDEIWVAFDGPRPGWSCWVEPVVELVGSEVRRPGPPIIPLFTPSAAFCPSSLSNTARHIAH